MTNVFIMPKNFINSPCFVIIMSLKSLDKNTFQFFLLCFTVCTLFNHVNGKPPVRLIGGMNAALGEIVYEASLRVNGSHKCGGTLVSTKHVLTAAHCVEKVVDSCKDLTVVTGTNSLERGGCVSNVEDIQVHENFKSNLDGSRVNDIALITLVEEIEVNKYQSPIDLPEVDTPDHVVALVSGWGYKNYDRFPDGEFSTILQKSNMTTLSNEECQRIHKWNTIDNKNICAVKNSLSGICKGDGGSPLVYKRSVVGIASWYYPCALGLPDVYTRVHHYLSWILENMSKSFYDDAGSS